MSYLLLVAGIIIIGITAYDIILTTFAPIGAGPLTGRYNSVFWKFCLWVSGSDPRKRILDYAGMSLCITTIFLWMVLIWAGNSLIYISDPDSVVSAENGIPADPLQKVYFVGYCLSSLGLGDFMPIGHGWEIYTAFISFTGFDFITMSITYFVPVI